MSNTSSLLLSLPVIFVLDRRGVGGGGRVRCFCLGISGGSCINPFQEVGGPRLFSQKNSKIPRPTYLNKKRTFPETFCMNTGELDKRDSFDSFVF